KALNSVEIFGIVLWHFSATSRLRRFPTANIATLNSSRCGNFMKQLGITPQPNALMTYSTWIMLLLSLLEKLCPATAKKTLAIRKVEVVIFWANYIIARHGA